MNLSSLCIAVVLSQWPLDHDINKPTIGVLAESLSDPAVSASLAPLPANPPKQGVIVSHVKFQSPAFRKLQPDDVITSAGGKPVRELADVADAINRVGVGKDLKIDGRRVSATGAKWVPFSEKVRVSTDLISAKQWVKPEVDAVRSLTIYKHFNQPALPSRTGVSVYLSVPEGKKPVAFLRLQYAGDDWIFLKQCVFKVGPKVETINLPDVVRDNAGGKVWEHRDVLIDARIAALLKDSLHFTDVTVRFSGDKYADYKLSDVDRDSIEQVMVVAKSPGYESP